MKALLCIAALVAGSFSALAAPLDYYAFSGHYTGDDPYRVASTRPFNHSTVLRISRRGIVTGSTDFIYQKETGPFSHVIIAPPTDSSIERRVHVKLTGRLHGRISKRRTVSVSHVTIRLSTGDVFTGAVRNDAKYSVGSFSMHTTGVFEGTRLELAYESAVFVKSIPSPTPIE